MERLFSVFFHDQDEKKKKKRTTRQYKTVLVPIGDFFQCSSLSDLTLFLIMMSFLFSADYQ